jgi:branched-chain amino acid transport system substrate-binding protein
MGGRKVRVSTALLVAALAIVLVVAVGACGSSGGGGNGSGGGTGNTAGDTIKVGAIVSLSGTYAALGQPEKNTLEMEVKKINDAGGVNGKQIELIVEDDGTDDAKAVAAASKLIDQDKVVAIIGPTGSSTTLAIKQTLDRAGVPEISMAAATPITHPVDSLVFAVAWPNSVVVPFTFDYMKSQGITKIGVISDTGGFGKDGLASIQADAPKMGMTVTGSETFNPGDTDMTAQLTKIKDSDAQAVLMWTAGSEATIIAKEVKDLGFKIPLYGSHGIANQQFIEGAGAAANGVKFAAGHILVPASYGKGGDAYTQATDFVGSYQAAYGTPPTTFAGHAFDAINMLAAAAQNVSGDITSSSLRDAIERTSGFVGIGGGFTFSPTDHNGLTADALTMYEIVNGKWTIASK